MNKKTLGVLLGTLAFGTMTVARADEAGADKPAPAKAKKGKKAKGDADKGKEGGDKGCAGKGGGDKGCSGKK